MVDDQIAEKSAAQKRTALLALATEKREAAGECLSPEAMTALIAVDCTADEKREALRHISLCRRCYGEWLILMELQLESGRQRRGAKIPFYLKPTNLAALVSAMAAVICVGLFLDINPFGYRIENELSPPIETLRQESVPAPAGGDQAADSIASPARSRQADKATQLTPIPSVGNRTIKTETVDRDAAEPPSPELKSAAPAPAAPRPEAAPPPPAEIDLKAEPVAPEKMMDQAEGRDRGTPSLSLEQWHRELAAVCRAREVQEMEQDRLDQLFRAGKNMLPVWRRQAPSSPAERSLQQRLLPLLDQSRDVDQLLARCPEILAADGTAVE